MKNDIIIAGVGGQGILSIAATIGYAAVEAGIYLKQSEVHGMSQRGGDVQSHFRLSDKPISSDMIPEGTADIIISVEPLEALRYVPMLADDGWLISNTKPYNNINNYPDIEQIYNEISKIENHLLVDADGIARDLGSSKSANIVVLGAASPFIDLDYKYLEKAIATLFGKKGEKVIASNIKALAAGRKIAEEHI